MVFRIFDHILANGIEAIFSFSILLLQINEAALLKLNFDGCLDYLKASLLDCYQIEDDGEQDESQFRVDDFVRDASKVKITPFQLDNYAAEYEELRKAQTAHLVEVDNLRNENRALKAQVCVTSLIPPLSEYPIDLISASKNLEEALGSVSEEHCGIIVSALVFV
jgi:ecotropic viral integration site 5 protein